MAKEQKNEEKKELKNSKETTTEELKASKIAEKAEKKPVKKETVKKTSAKKIEKKEEKISKNKLKKSEKKHSKKYREVLSLIEKGKEYDLSEALELAKKTSTTKFDSSIEIHIKLGIDPKKTDQMIRGVIVLPNGTGKIRKVCTIVGPGQEKEAKESGADVVGGDDIIQKIEKGWLDFDILVATPDMMAALSRVAKVLGPKGLMPNPKANTVTQDIARVVKDIKKGQIEYKNDVTGITHNVIGKVSFDSGKLKENYEAYLDALKRSRPDSSKGVFIKQVVLATTMGPSVKVKI